MALNLNALRRVQAPTTGGHHPRVARGGRPLPLSRNDLACGGVTVGHVTVGCVTVCEGDARACWAWGDEVSGSGMAMGEPG